MGVRVGVALGVGVNVGTGRGVGVLMVSSSVAAPNAVNTVWVL